MGAGGRFGELQTQLLCSSGTNGKGVSFDAMGFGQLVFGYQVSYRQVLFVSMSLISFAKIQTYTTVKHNQLQYPHHPASTVHWHLSALSSHFEMTMGRGICSLSGSPWQPLTCPLSGVNVQSRVLARAAPSSFGVGPWDLPAARGKEWP